MAKHSNIYSVVDDCGNERWSLNNLIIYVNKLTWGKRDSGFRILFLIYMFKILIQNLLGLFLTFDVFYYLT